MATTTVSANVAREVNQIHAKIVQGVREFTARHLADALRAGELLTQQKARLAHGQWLRWLDENIEFSQPTASRYMKCWKRRELFTVNNLEDVSVTEAYRLMEPEERIEPKPAIQETDAEDEAPQVRTADEEISGDREEEPEDGDVSTEEPKPSQINWNEIELGHVLLAATTHLMRIPVHHKRRAAVLDRLVEWCLENKTNTEWREIRYNDL